MFRLVRAIALLATLTALAATAAAAGGNALRLSVETGPLNPIVDPSLIAARCPAGYDWVALLRGTGTGAMTSAAYTGPVSFSSEHCTRILVSKRPGTAEMHSVGKNIGEVTVVTPNGDELYVDYQGTFVLNGLLPVAYRTDASASWTITGGTGVFAGASGSGHMDVVDTPTGDTVEWRGSLQPAG